MIRDTFIILVGSVIFAFALNLAFPQSKPAAAESIISPLVKSMDEVRSIIVGYPKEELKEVVERSLAGTSGTYGIVIKNLNTGEIYTQNENKIFDSASLYKLWVMGTVYKQINAGDLTPNKVFSAEVAELNRIFDIDEESAERTEGSVTYSVKNALEAMITISDNYAAHLLVSNIKISNVTKFLQEQNLKNSKTGSPPQTTAEDIALFYENLFLGNIVNSESSNEMMEILKRQELNDRIPKYLPEEIEVAHKTGELGGAKHDAGIIFGKDPILFVALSDSNSPQGAAERIARLSRDVFNYFEGK